MTPWLSDSQELARRGCGVLAVRLRELLDTARCQLHIAAQLVPASRQNLLRLLGMLLHGSGRARHPRTNRHMLPQPGATAERFEFKAPLGAGLRRVADVPGQYPGRLPGDNVRRRLPLPAPLLPISADKGGPHAWALGVDPGRPEELSAKAGREVDVTH